MKNIFLLLLVTFSFHFVNGQSDATIQPLETDHKNEFGIEATSFIQRFISLTNPLVVDQTPVFLITYRRYLNSGNIRTGIGGSIQNTKRKSPIDSTNFAEDELIFSTLSGRLGWEFKTELAKRWQVYYGADLVAGISNYETRTSNTIIPIRDYNKHQSHYYGISPMLGFRFRMNNRLSLLTEMSLNAVFHNAKTEIWRESDDPNFTTGPRFGPQISNGFRTELNLPVRIYITFTI